MDIYSLLFVLPEWAQSLCFRRHRLLLANDPHQRLRPSLNLHGTPAVGATTVAAAARGLVHPLDHRAEHTDHPQPSRQLCVPRRHSRPPPGRHARLHRRRPRLLHHRRPRQLLDDPQRRFHRRERHVQDVHLAPHWPNARLAVQLPQRASADRCNADVANGCHVDGIPRSTGCRALCQCSCPVPSLCQCSRPFGSPLMRCGRPPTGNGRVFRTLRAIRAIGAIRVHHRKNDRRRFP